jgi:hypothetical protein
VSDWIEGQERDHQAIAVANGAILTDWSAGFWFILVDQLLAKIEQLDARNDRSDWRPYQRHIIFLERRPSNSAQ